MSTSAFLQTMLAKRRPIPLMEVRANIIFCFPSTFVLRTRSMCWNSSLATRDCGFPPPPDTSKIQIQIQIQIHTLTCTFKINHKTEQKFNISYYHFGLAETEPAKERIRRQKAQRCGRSEVEDKASNPWRLMLLIRCRLGAFYKFCPLCVFEHFLKGHNRNNAIKNHMEVT